jgi:hypothetical protein
VRFYREEITSRIDLRRLGSLEVDALVRGMGIANPAPELVEQVLKASQGNPFMVMSSTKESATSPGPRRFSGSVLDLRLPSELTAPALQRFRGLSEDCQSLLTEASVWASPVPWYCSRPSPASAKTASRS